MNDGNEHEVPRPKLVRTGCRLFDIGIECGREIHGENEVLLKVKFCEGKGDISL